MQTNVVTCNIDYDCVLSDYFPIILKTDIALNNLIKTKTPGRQKIKWTNEKTVKKYYHNLDKNCTINHDWNICNKAVCNNPHHCGGIENAYDNLIAAIFYAETKACSNGTRKTQGYKPKAGWNDMVKVHYANYKNNYKLWRNMDKPSMGPLFESLRHVNVYLKLN